MTMPFRQLEQAYECLAAAIDRAGPSREALFLAKLALTLAHRLGDLDGFEDAVAVSLQDLPEEMGEDAGARLGGA